MPETVRHCVLCVESSVASRRVLEVILRDYDCAFASDPHEALALILATPCDAYVLDYWMPAWSGPLLCRQIRKSDPHCTIIVCGHGADPADENRAFSAGASGYVTELVSGALTSKLFASIAVGDVDSDRAQTGASRVLASELDRYIDTLTEANRGAGTADEVERTVRSRTLRAYIDGGGTRARFQKWWPYHFKSQRIAREM